MRIAGLTMLALVCAPFVDALSNPTRTSSPKVEEVGITPPFTGKFDPLGFSDNVPTIEVARLRESELKHARAAMVGATVIPIVEMMTGKPGINFVSSMPVNTQIGLLALVGAGEFSSMLKGWENPFEEGSPKAFKLKEDYQPGDLGFRPSSDLSEEEYIEFANKELNNGRLAMFAALGMIVQELVTGKTLL